MLFEDRRRQRIKQILASIKKATNPDFDKLVGKVMFEYGIAKRTAREYIEAAKSQL